MSAQDHPAQTTVEPAAARDCLAEITIFTKSSGPLTKRIWLQDGKLASDSSSCRMAKGTARRVKIDGVQAFAEIVNNLPPNQAYALGRLKDGLPDRVRVVTDDKLNGEDSSVIARTKDFLVFKEGELGLALLDVDLKGMSDTVKRRIEECGGDIWGALCEVVPVLETVACVQRASTSSRLRNVDTGETFPGSGGQHIAIPVLDAADIPRFLSDLHDHCWLKGLGWGMVSAAGSFLERAIIDKSVGSPERLIFEGPPIVEYPLVQEGRNAIAHDGTVLDTRSLCPPLSDAEKAEVQRLKAAEVQRLLPERQAARAKWSVEHITRLVDAGMPEAEARAQVDRWIDRQELSGAFPLPFDEPSIAGTTVEAVLAAPENYVGKTLSDPVEGPSYGRGVAILYRRPNGSLWIKSFAHGGIAYELKTGLEAEVGRLAKLSDIQYEQERGAVADKWKVRVTKLDQFVARARGNGNDKGEPLPYEHWAVEPWPEPVDGGTMLRAITEVVQRYVFMSKDQAVAVALWIVFSWLHEFLTHSPILYVTSAEKGSGKSTLVGVLNFLVRYGMQCVSISAAPLYRSITKWHPTLIVDEADNAFANNPELLAVFNSGWTRGQGVLRCNPDTFEPERFETFTPKVVAMKGRKLPDTTLSRSIIATMKPRRASDPKEHVADFDHLDNEMFARLRSQLARWSVDNAEAIAKAKPEIPPGFDNRRRANWKSLLAIGEACGGEWKVAAWKAALAIEAVADAFDSSVGIELLRAIKAVFEARKDEPRNNDRIKSEDLIKELTADQTAPWSTYNKGKPISERQVAGLLKGYEMPVRRGFIKPKTIRLDDGTAKGTTAKGYLLEWFTDAFARYCASPEENPSPPGGEDVADQTRESTPSPPWGDDLSVTSVTSLNSQGFSQFSIRHKPDDVTDEKAEKPFNINDVTDVTDTEGGGKDEGCSSPSKDEGEPAPSTPWTGLSPRAVDQLAREFSGLRINSAVELENAIHSRLAKYVPTEAIGAEVAKVMHHIKALGDGSRTTVDSPVHVSGATKPASYETFGWGPPGSRCDSCGKGIGIKRIKFGDRVALLHRDCADRYFAAMADQPSPPPTSRHRLPLNHA